MKIKRNLNKLLAMVFLWLVASCGKKPAVSSTSDQYLTLQVMPATSDIEDKSLTFRVRLIPQRAVLDSISANARQALLYRMDSCLYLKYSRRLLDPVLVQPVTAVTAGTFEYLVTFTGTGKLIPAPKLIYRDRYISRHQYEITLLFLSE